MVTPSKHLLRQLQLTIIFSLFVMCLGSYVRSRDAGLACPDWPLCYGKWIPFLDFQIFLEWIHRVCAAALVILLGLTATTILRERKWRQQLAYPLMFAGILLVVQIILGGLTVLQLVNPKIVSFHLINAVLYLGVLIGMKIRVGLSASAAQIRPRLAWPLVVSGAIFLQIFLGGSVSTHYAGTVCPDFPTCFGQWFPSYQPAVWLQMSHRYLAYVVAALIVGWCVVEKRGRLSFHSRKAVRWLPILVSAQIVLGMINVYAGVPAWASVLHLANALFMFSLSLAAAMENWYAGEPQTTWSEAYSA